MGHFLTGDPGHFYIGANTEIHDLKKTMVGEFGPDVNIADVMPDDVLETETLRCGLGVVEACGSASYWAREMATTV